MNIPVYVLLIFIIVCTVLSVSAIISMTVIQHKITNAKEQITTEIQNFDVIYMSKKDKERLQKLYKKVKIVAVASALTTMLSIFAYSYLSAIAMEHGISDVNNQIIQTLIDNEK